jgi:hypothetical protein
MFNDGEREENLNTRLAVQEALSWLRQFGLRGAVVQEPVVDRTVDAFVQVRAGSGATRTYAADLKRSVRPELASALHPHAELPTLILARSITERAAEVLRARDIDYLDEAGNAHLAWDDVLIDVRGRRVPERPRSAYSPRGRKAFGRAGLQVGFALLSWPHLAAAPLRRLASVSGVSLGSTKMIVDDLSTAGYLYEVAGKRRLTGTGELLSRWSEAYSITLAPALALGEFSVPDISWWRTAEEELTGAGVQVGGEAAASLLDPRLVPASLTLYAEEIPLALVGRHRLARANGLGNVSIRRRFWAMPGDAWIVPTPLVYADLLASGDPRQREHADRIRIDDDRLADLTRG